MQLVDKVLQQQVRRHQQRKKATITHLDLCGLALCFSRYLERCHNGQTCHRQPKRGLTVPLATGVSNGRSGAVPVLARMACSLGVVLDEARDA